MKHRDELHFPCLETPKRCFLTSLSSSSSSSQQDESDGNNRRPNTTQNLSCNRNGSLSMSSQFTDSEEWELVPQHGDSFALKSVKRNVYLTIKNNTCKDETTTITNGNNQTPSMSSEVTICKRFESLPEQLWDIEMTTSSEHMGIIIQIRNIATDQSLAYFDYNNQLSCINTQDNDQQSKLRDGGDGFPPSSSTTTATTTPSTTTTLWRIEFQSGELCFLSNPSADRRLKCNAFGHLSLEKDNWKGWEVWRFIDVGNYELLITSWTHTTRILASNWAGRVVTTEDRYGFGTRWRVMKGTTGNGVLLQSVETGRYLRVAADNVAGNVAYDASYPRPDVNNNNRQQCVYDFNTVDRPEEFGTEWQLESANRNVFYMLGKNNDKLLSCTRNGQSTTLATKPSSFEEWKVTKVFGFDNKYEIYSCSSKRYLGVDDQDLAMVLGVDRNKSNDAQKLCCLWDIEVSATGGYIITSASNSNIPRYVPRRLYYNTDKSCWAVSSKNHDDFEWSLHPKMPSSISGPQLGAMIGAGVGALALTVAAPFAFTWGVAAIGFGAEGITAGTMAAAMMSAEAVASGGGIVTGGLVATLQSIGAAGLGVAGTSAAMGGGALLGTAGLGITAAVVNGKDGEHGRAGATTATAASSSAQEPEDELELLLHDELSRLPLCAWRSW